jgi:alpha-tubulin suppressor-like RCC1 family protein
VGREWGDQDWRENARTFQLGAEINLVCAPSDAGVTDSGGADAGVVLDGCVPTTCAAHGFNCGTISDGCGGTLNCGTCPAPSICGGNPSAPNVCETGCTPVTCTARGFNCGAISDGCGGFLNCGACPSPLLCGGGGVANVCGSAGADGGGAGPDGGSAFLTSVTGLSVGRGFACAVTSGGAVQCWGYNGSGMLGNNTTTSSAVPVQVAGLTSGVTQVSCGNFACAVTAGGGVECWGDNTYGKLGNNSTTISLVPVQVTDLASGVTAVSAGAFSACAVTSGGAVQCWGYNGTGQLGNNSTTNSSVPVQVAGLSSGATSVSVGLQSTCAITAGGGVQCWGDNTYGELGNNSTASSLVPVQVVGLTSGVVALSVGDYSACAVTAGGAVQCWGAGGGAGSALGSSAPTICAADGGGSASFCSPVPIQVIGLTSGATGVSVGDHTACAVTAGGGVQCWGDNSSGELGNNSTTNSLAPVQVAGLTGDAIAVSVLGGPSTCALAAGGSVECWGDNRYGELGNSSTTNSSIPVQVVCGGAGTCGPCMPRSPVQACGNLTCGSAPDGCGGVVSCGPCAANQICTSAGQCCSPATTCPAGLTCGVVADGCGGTLNCGACTAPQTCGGGGTANQCGVCVPATACPVGQVCGTAPDGCGGVIDCGLCAGNQVCGADGHCHLYCDGNTISCLQAQDKSTSDATTRCSTCTQANGCLDPAMQGGTCEMVAGNANLFPGMLQDGKTCSQVFGPPTVLETTVCLQTLATIFSSRCAASLEETPCLCGTTDPTSCLAGTATPNGPAYDEYVCDFNTTSGNTINAVTSDFTVLAFGAGMANAIVQCAAAFSCDCF